MIHYLKTILYLACLSGISASAAESSWNGEVALPSDSKIVIRWVVPPVKNREKLNDIKFSVGPDETPWIGYNHKYLMNPVKKYFLELSNQYNDMIQLDNGALLISTATEFGYPMSRKLNEKSPVVGFQPIAKLPIPGCRMFKGVDNCVYFSGWNQAASQYEIYLLKPENLSSDGSKTIKEYKKIFSWPQNINAVSGDGNISFAATGNTIFYIPANGDSAKIVFKHPTEAVKQLQVYKNFGLFYATDNRVGYLGGGGQFEFFKGERPQISLSGSSLYIFSESDFGIVAFDNIGDLDRLDFHDEPLLPISLSELLIILFFAIVLAAMLFVIVSIRRKSKTKPATGNKPPPPPAAKQERNEIMSGKLYVKPPKGVLIAQIVIVPLFMLFGLSFIFLAEGEAAIFAVIFVFIWEAACIAILANAIKLLKQGGVEIAEFKETSENEIKEDIKEEDFAKKLRDIESLKADGLLSEDEYRIKREEILNKKW